MKRTNWILVLVLVLAIGTYFLFKHESVVKLANATPTPTGLGFLLQVSDSNPPIDLTITDSKYNTFEMERGEDETWQILAPTASPADQGQAEAAITQLGAIAIVVDVTDTTNLAGFGLTTPAYVIKVTNADKTSHVISIGSTTPTGSGYYARLDNSRVYVVSTDSIDSLTGMIKSPPYPATATPTAQTSTAVPTVPVQTATPLPLLATAPATATP
jgi:hypothetical protein